MSTKHHIRLNLFKTLLNHTDQDDFKICTTGPRLNRHVMITVSLYIFVVRDLNSINTDHSNIGWSACGFSLLSARAALTKNGMLGCS